MKVYRWFLALYPRRFRERFAAGMQSAVSAEYAPRAQAGQAGGAGVSHRHGTAGGVVRHRRTAAAPKHPAVVPVGRRARRGPLAPRHAARDRRRGAVAGPGHRRQHRVVLDSEHTRAQAAPGPRSAAAGDRRRHRLVQPDLGTDPRPAGSSCSRARLPGRSSDSTSPPRGAPIPSPAPTSAADCFARSASRRLPAGRWLRPTTSAAAARMDRWP